MLGAGHIPHPGSRQRARPRPGPTGPARAAKLYAAVPSLHDDVTPKPMRAAECRNTRSPRSTTDEERRCDRTATAAPCRRVRNGSHTQSGVRVNGASAFNATSGAHPATRPSRSPNICLRTQAMSPMLHSERRKSSHYSQPPVSHESRGAPAMTARTKRTTAQHRNVYPVVPGR